MSEEVIGGNAAGRLKSFIERLERLDADKADIMADIKDVKAEAKGEGFDVKVINRIIRHRKTDKAKRQEEQAIFETYLNAIGEED